VVSFSSNYAGITTMNRILCSAVTAAMFAALYASSASGTQLLYDSFNYSPSGTSLGTAGAPTWVKNGTSPDPTVQAVGGLTYPGLQVASNNVSLQYDGSGVNAGSGAPAATDGTTISTGITSGNVYYSLLLKVTAVQANGGNGFGLNANLVSGSFMAGLMTSAATAAPAVDTTAAPLLIRSGDGTQFSTTYQLGTSKTATSADRQFYTGQTYNVNDTVFVVLKYAFDATNGDSASLFINPTPGAAEPAPQLTVSTGTNLSLGTPAGIKSFFVRNNSVEPDTLLIDELRIGDTWQDVTPAAGAGIAGDYNGDGKVDAADYIVWRSNPAAHGGNPAGYDTWRANFGRPPGAGSGLAGAAVPEAATSGLAFWLAGAVGMKRRRRTRWSAL
jgi:hypothetical protein